MWQGNATSWSVFWRNLRLRNIEKEKKRVGGLPPALSFILRKCKGRLAGCFFIGYDGNRMMNRYRFVTDE
ncbi:MAG: hypothetical protein IJW63_05375 [Lachnospiraceae bacterium]|nr:hypothetical protein [Lachnospiraceae bacterium]